MFTYKEVDIFYERSETGDKPVLLLHGWGLSGKAMSGVYRFLETRGKRVIAPDLPAFGKSSPPPENADVFFYADAIEALLERENAVGCDVIAHSFGARIAVILASRGLVGKLMIVDGAGLKPRKTLKTRLKARIYKIKRALGLDVSKCGSDDYRALDEHMKKVFVSVVNCALDNLLPLIKCETLIVWGKTDRETPPYMARQFKEGIVGSEIVWLEGGHFAYIENPFVFLRVTEAFLCQ